MERDVAFVLIVVGWLSFNLFLFVAAICCCNMIMVGETIVFWPSTRGCVLCVKCIGM